MKAFIIYATHDIIDNKTVVQLFGRLENGQSFVATKKISPYFFVRKKDSKKLKEKPEDTKLKNFQGEEVVRISFENQTDLINAYKEYHHEVDIYEADLKPQTRFIIDNDLLGNIEIEGEYEPSEKIDRVYKEPKISPIAQEDFTPKLKLISLDTECDTKGKLYCIGLYGENYRKNFMITKHELKHTIPCKSEEECLEKFKSEIIKLDPDVIIGWNVIDHDFSYLRELFRKHKIPFDIGRTNDEPRLRIESNFFKSSSINVPGRQVLDGINLIRDPLIKEAPSIKFADFESFRLEDVSQAILGKGKLLKGKDRHKEIESLYKTHTEKSLQTLAEYNLIDCELVYEILKKTMMIELAIERSQLTGLTFDRLTGSIVAFDSLYIREARKNCMVSPTNEYKRKETRITGGYVHSSNAGVYKNVLVFDFKSLYASIIQTFNIDPSSFLGKKEEKGCIKAPNGACFRNQDGLLPQILRRLHNAREKAKKEKRELSNYAIKTIMNSFWGVLASPNLRYFDLDMANAITSSGRFIVQLTAKEIEKMGYKTIYSDTDSVFVETKLGKEKANALGKKIAEDINKFYDNYAKKNFNRKSYLELEFEKQYLSMIIPQIRGGDVAAKKRYAGLLDKSGKEEVEVVGLEAIRGDWTDAAQDFQLKLLDKLFHDQPIDSFIRDYLKKIRSGKLDEKLIYRKSIRKNLEEYTKTTPPHVKAARKLDNLESNVIEYYITLDGPEPIQKLKHKIDYEHYVTKQIKPIAEQILSLFNKKFEDITQDSKQTKLF